MMSNYYIFCKVLFIDLKGKVTKNSLPFTFRARPKAKSKELHSWVSHASSRNSGTLAIMPYLQETVSGSWTGSPQQPGHNQHCLWDTDTPSSSCTCCTTIPHQRNKLPNIKHQSQDPTVQKNCFQQKLKKKKKQYPYK